MIALTLFGEPLTVDHGEWDYSNAPESRVLVESALSIHFDPADYHPDLDLDLTNALTAAWGDGVRIFAADRPGDVADAKPVIY